MQLNNLKYNAVRVYALFTIIIFVSCSKEPLSPQNEISTVNFKISIAKNNDAQDTELFKPQTPPVISKILVTIHQYLPTDTIITKKEFTQSNGTWTATVELEKGRYYMFDVEASDAEDIVWYEGDEYADISNENESVSITLYQCHLNLSVLTTTAHTVTLSWSEYFGSDFKDYSIHRSGDGHNFGGIENIATRTTTTYTDINLTPNTTYWYCVIAWTTGYNIAQSNDVEVTMSGN